MECDDDVPKYMCYKYKLQNVAPYAKRTFPTQPNLTRKVQ